MNVDRLPDSPDNPDPAAETPRLNEAPRPPDNPRSSPTESEPEHHPAPDQQPRPERGAETAPEQPESATGAAPNNTPDVSGSSEARSRQEHAELALGASSLRPQRQRLTDESRSNEESSGQHEDALNPRPVSSHDHSDEPVGEAAEAIRPLTQQERAEHIADVFTRLDKADDEGFSSNELHTIDPKGEIWSADRTLLHQSLLDDIYSGAADVPCDHKAIVAGGLSGAGKTTVLAHHPEIDRSSYLTINPDNIKEEMARRGMVPEVEGLSPMEASELVHEESSYLARQLAIRAQEDGKNLIWDITMSDQEKTEQRISDLREAGYTKVDAIFVQIPIETSLRRTEERYWADQGKWFEGEGLGGRLIPPEVILRQADEEWGSGNRKTFEAIKATVNDWEIQDNSADGGPAALVDRRKPEDPAPSK